MKKKRGTLFRWLFALSFLLIYIGTIGITGVVQAGFATYSETKLTAGDAAYNDNLGYSVSISGDTIVAGAPFDNKYTGAAYVYVREGSIWVQQAKLTANNGVEGDLFGWSVSISGDLAAIGAQRKNSYQGAVYIFERSGSTWSQQAELNGNETERSGGSGDSGALDNPCFGCSVSISGDTVVAGANNSNNAAGAAYVFVRNGSTWIQEAEILGDDTVAYDEYGSAVSVSGDTAVVVASGRPTGAAYVFVRNGSGWSQQAELNAPGGVADGFGSVAISGDIAILGAFNGFNVPGEVYAYKRDGSSWIPQTRMVPNDTSVNDSFGCSVSISGNTALVGAFSQSGTGAAYVFVYDGVSWNQQAKLTASDAAARDEIGYSVSMSGGTAILGAPLKKDKAGAVYAFEGAMSPATPGYSTTSAIATPVTEQPQEHNAPFSFGVIIGLGVLAVIGILIFIIRNMKT